jgi:hypothetical protein
MPGAERSPAPPVRGTARSTLASLTAAIALAGGLVAGCGSSGADHPVPASSGASLTQPAALSQAAAVSALRDDGPVQVVRGQRSVVVSSRRSGIDAADLARRVDVAVPVATGFWRTSWAQPVVVLVPASLAHWKALTGLSPDPDVAAVSLGASSAEASGATSSSAATGATGATGASGTSGDGQRIVVDPGAYLRLSDAGRGVVLRHEVEHLVSASHTPPGMPSWLVEGTADVVGFTGSGIPVSQAAEELASLVRSSGAPASLPADADFAGGSSSVAYEEGWLASRLIIRDKGATALRAFYDGVAAGIRARNDSPTPERLVDEALRQATGWSLADFVARWRADLQLELGSAP